MQELHYDIENGKCYHGDSKLPQVFVCLCASLPFPLDGFLFQWEVLLKKSSISLAKLLLYDGAAWSLTMHPPTGRQMALVPTKAFTGYLESTVMQCISPLM